MRVRKDGACFCTAPLPLTQLKFPNSFSNHVSKSFLIRQRTLSEGPTTLMELNLCNPQAPLFLQNLEKHAVVQLFCAQANENIKPT